ncbi:MAG TPA: fibronectin type III domain-containing protein [Actinomycetota bacterium]|nr:fibronectin type III domain-containing protein [Actinomycetota bacterium]
MKKRSTRNRLVLAMLALLVLGTGHAKADPLDDVQKLLLSADGVTATGISSTQIFVSWNDRTLVETGYRIEISKDEAGPYTKAANSPACPLSDRVCTYTIPASPAADIEPRFIRVVPIITFPPTDPEGTVVFEGKPSDPDPAMLGPQPPTNLQCNGGGDLACVNVTNITLTWTDNSDEAEFWIMRARGAVNPNFGSQEHAKVNANVTTYSERITEFGATFSYRIVAVRVKTLVRLDGNTHRELSFSNSRFPNHAVVDSAPLPPPTDPSGLSAVLTPPGTAVLTWTDREFNSAATYIEEDGWFIEQTTGDADWESEFASQHTRPRFAGQGTPTWTDTNIPPDTSRCYRVRGYRASSTFTAPANSQYTNTACLGSPPRAPSDLVAVAKSSALVNLKWVDNSNSETHFVVQRCKGTCLPSNTTWEDIDDVARNVTEYDDEDVSGLTVYSYRVFAQNFSGRSLPSNIAVVTTPPAQVLGPGLSLRAVGGHHEINLTWDDNATDETGYRIDYRSVGGEWSVIDEVGPNVSTYADMQSLGANQTRCYRVRAVKNQELSDPSNEACATTLPPAAPNGDPTNLVASPPPQHTGKENTRLDLTWDDNATNESSYRIEYVAFNDLHCSATLSPIGAAWQLYGSAPKHDGTGTRMYPVENLIPHTAYFFRVKAVNPDGESAWSEFSTCAATKGPFKPIFKDPNAHATLRATQCNFTLEGPADAGDHDRILGYKFFVTSIVPNTNVAHTDTIFVGSRVPGAFERPSSSVRWLTNEGVEYSINRKSGSPQDEWTIPYEFRKGPNYRIVAQSFLDASEHHLKYSSQLADVRDFKVLADCPVPGGDPLP